MTSITIDEAGTRPLQRIHSTNLPSHSQEPSFVASVLDKLIDSTATHHDVSHTIHAPMHLTHLVSSLHSLIPGIEKYATEYHVGNYVVVRATGEKFFESMPIYGRLGMHLLFYGHTEIKVLHEKSVEAVLEDLSIREGKTYDSPESVKSIPSFIRTYSLELDQLLYPDISYYKCFNEFFYRKLKPDARPVAHPDDPTGICSAADCRLTVYQNIDLAKKFWIKGNHFTVANLLGVAEDSPNAQAFDGSSVAIFRLAPADYHRFHSPIDGVVGETFDIAGEYYTVNPQAVNEPNFDVFTDNKRSVLYMTHRLTGQPVAFVAIGAMLVGSIKWTAGGEKGRNVSRGDELGYFAYGGSTIVALFSRGLVTFDEDLLRNSESVLETQMKVGWSLGRSQPPAAAQ
ncbi:phosphatidylserine decarboxylase-domain-containing protein [Sparassis latifolia]